MPLLRELGRRRRRPRRRCWFATPRGSWRSRHHDRRGHSARAATCDRLTQLSPSLWWYRDTCNVYLWTAGERGLLIDFGSGGILDVLERTGVREIVAIVHTHHHRDQCGGDDRAAALGIPIWVPARERAPVRVDRGVLAPAADLRQLRRLEPRLHAGDVRPGRPRARRSRAHRVGRWDLRGPSRRRATRRARSASSRRSTATTVAFTGDLIAGPAASRPCTTCSGSTGCPTRSAPRSTPRPPGRHARPDASCPPMARRWTTAGGAPGAGREPSRLARLLAEIRRNRLWTTLAEQRRPAAEPGRCRTSGSTRHSVANT